MRVCALLRGTVGLIAFAAAAAVSVAASAEKLFLSGPEAELFLLPTDVQATRTVDLQGTDLTYERYQQTFAGAAVLGGQITLYRDEAGTIRTVIGAHYPDIRPVNRVRLSPVDARDVADREVGPEGRRLVSLHIDPRSGRFFFKVETRRPDSRWILWIDAGNGAVINRYDALANDCWNVSPPCGFGVGYDRGDGGDIKSLDGLTTLNGSEYELRSTSSSPPRQETHDQGSSRRPFLGPVATDGDDSWIDPGAESPAQPALVDAQYYAAVTDGYYSSVHGYDWVAQADESGANDRMEIHAHYSKDYNNAFWNGEYIALGDGDGTTFRELTALDVVGHELTHGVTDFTSNLIYEDESGALNESFSDIMGSSMEFYADVSGLEPSSSLVPDWLIGEDFDLRGDTVPGFRNMADPEEDDDPDHYSERYTGSQDNGGVHTNSGIPNHAYYLLVNGGENASCASPDDHDSAHCGNDDVSVTRISRADAEVIAFLGFTALVENATMCDARAATEAVAGAQFGSTSQQLASTTDSWVAVGLTDGVCDTSADGPPSASIANPSDGDTVSGKVTVQVDAADDEDGAGSLTVEVSIDGDAYQTAAYDSSNGYYEYEWDTTAVSDGEHTVDARATDSADQTTSATTVTVTVDNGGDNGGGGGPCKNHPDHWKCQ